MKKNQRKPQARRIPITFRVNTDEMHFIIAASRKYFEGNVSLLVRAALKKYKN